MTLFDDAEMEAQPGRTLIAANAQSADLGEALATVARVTPGAYDGWFAQWSATARAAQAWGEAQLAAGRSVTARQAFLRATEYWRQAIFFIRNDLDDARLQEGWRAHRAAFRAAIPLLDADVVVDQIPLDGARMTAYLLRSPVPARSAAGRPVVLAPCGYDSTAEAGYAATGYMALKHGYDCLLWDGPGQGDMLYEQRVPMRPDFESVLVPVVDWLLAQEDVDPGRLAVIGRSFAGYLAPRGVSGESRISALVCDPGQLDFVSRLVGTLFEEQTWARILAADPDLDAELQARLDDPHQREWYGARMATMGATSVGELLRMQPAYTLEGRLERIACPVLVTEGEGDVASPSRELHEALPGRNELKLFRGGDGAGGIGEGLGATLSEEAVFDWLDRVL